MLKEISAKQSKLSSSQRSSSSGSQAEDEDEDEERNKKQTSGQFICTTFRPEMVLVADKCYGVTFHNKTSGIGVVSQQDALSFVDGEAPK